MAENVKIIIIRATNLSKKKTRIVNKIVSADEDVVVLYDIK